MRLRPLLAVLLAALVLAPLAATAPAGGALLFGAPATLPLSAGHAEPSVEVAPDGTVYVVAPQSRTSVWRSLDGGASFERMRDSLGRSGDSDVAVDAAGRVYVSDLRDGVPVSVSVDRAGTWLGAVATAPGEGALDRQWLAAAGEGRAWSAFREDGAAKVARTDDGGLTWSGPVTVAPEPGVRGKPVVAPGGALLFPYATAGQLHLASSADGGATWTRATVAAAASDLLVFPSVAVDDAGVVYVAWAQGSGLVDVTTRVLLARSLDGGRTFGAPLVLSEPGRAHVFPWVVAGAAGRVALAWYEGAPPQGLPASDPNAAALTQWRVRVAASHDAHEAAPSWTHAHATGVVHVGPVCTLGGFCLPVRNPLLLDRAMLDFFEMDLLPGGRLVVAYAADAPGGGTLLQVARQTGGPTLR